MTKTINNNAKTTEENTFGDLIDHPLRSLRITGSLLLRESYAAPWSIDIPQSQELGSLLQLPSGAMAIAFHLVEFGHCWVQTDDEEISLSTGEMVISFGGVPHTLYLGKSRHHTPIATLLAGGPNIQKPRTIQNADCTSLLCGVFIVRDTTLNPLFSALPNLLHTSLSRISEMHNLSGVARLITEEIDRNSFGSHYMIERLLEILCAEAIRSHIETSPHNEPSWFKGIKDPIINRALSAIHKQPSIPWSVKKLADHVAMSPSRFSARFVAAMGNSPMNYLAKWRMNLACQMLATTKQPLEKIATEIGYENTTAFSRAFKKHTGLSPANWRSSNPSNES